MKKWAYILVLFGCFSCDYFNLKQEEKPTETPIASVGNSYLYKKDIANLLPKDIAKNDSLVLAKSIISSWAKNEILLAKAQENISATDNNKIKELVEEYQQSLYINDYKERLIKQQLDTVISQEEIDTFYVQNKNNFRLNQDLFRIKYIYFGNDFLDKKEVKKLFKSSKEEDLDSLQKKVLNFKSYYFNDQQWMDYDAVLEQIPPLANEPKQNLLKVSKLLQKEDSLGVYLVAVKEFRKKYAVAPQSYVSHNVKEIILHKRKLELIREIEKTLINDAIKNKTFKEY